MSEERLDPAEAELQQWIDGLLTSDETAPAALRGTIQRSLRRKGQRNIALKCMTAAAAILAIFLLLPKTPVNVDRQVVSTPNNPAPTNTPPVATFVGRSDLIVVPIKSSDPTVTIVQIYPTTITHRRWQREAALRAALTNTPEPPVQGG